MARPAKPPTRRKRRRHRWRMVRSMVQTIGQLEALIAVLENSQQFALQVATLKIELAGLKRIVAGYGVNP